MDYLFATENADDGRRLSFLSELYDQASYDMIAAVATGCNVLDVGCGVGSLISQLCAGGYRAAGVDISIGNGVDCGRLIRASALSLPFEDHAFDLVHARMMLSHLGSGLPQGIAEIRRVMRPSGHLIVGELDYSARHAFTPAFERYRSIIREIQGNSSYDADVARNCTSILQRDFKLLHTGRLTVSSTRPSDAIRGVHREMVARFCSQIGDELAQAVLVDLELDVEFRSSDMVLSCFTSR